MIYRLKHPHNRIRLRRRAEYLRENNEAYYDDLAGKIIKRRLVLSESKFTTRLFLLKIKSFSIYVKDPKEGKFHRIVWNRIPFRGPDLLDYLIDELAMQDSREYMNSKPQKQRKLKAKDLHKFLRYKDNLPQNMSLYYPATGIKGFWLKLRWKLRAGMRL